MPIAGASIQLYAMGMSGYGSAATLYATTTTSNDGYGSFAFSKSTSLTGPTAPTTPNYGCPASGDPQMYLTASGGNTQGIGSSNNTAVRYAVAIGPCSGITAATYVNMNEVTNVATMAALAQFFNPVTESFGAPASTQAYAALVNAVATVNILANVAAGTANPVVTPGSNVAGVSIQATPEYQKVNTLANILASCVNTTAATSQTCSALFAAAVPPAPAVTNQPLATFTAATDTLQAAYYLLTNPASSGSANIAALFGLTVATPPFQPQLSAAPTDWTIGISYDAGGSTCGPTSGGFISSPVTVAVDGNGMVWIGNGQSSIGNLTAMTPTGGAMVCALGTIDSSTAGAVLDANNNVYVASHAAGSAAITRTDNTGKNATTITTAGPVASIAADAVGDVYFVTDATSTVYKIPAGSTSPASLGASSGGCRPSLWTTDRTCITREARQPSWATTT